MRSVLWRPVAVALVALAAVLGLFSVPASAATAPAWPLVVSGQQNTQVKTVQYLLRQRGETITADGIFGSGTKAAVERFQAANGLDPDGAVGPLTWAKLVLPLNTGASGEAVKGLQVQLNRYGYGLSVDGAFGPATGGAVTDFKADRALGTGSAVDTTVWQWLVGSTPPGEMVAPGVEYNKRQVSTSHGSVTEYVLTVDLTKAHLGLTWPGKVAQVAAMTTQADRVGAVAAVNGDFFNINGTAATGAPVGPAIANGHDLKAAVPGAQRYGPTRPAGTGNTSVFGVTTDGKPVITTLDLDGTVTTPTGSFALQGLNQYAITVGGVGAFNPDWGSASRLRATCGTDTDRLAGCSTQTKEVEIADGKVTRVSTAPGSGQIAAGHTVLLARDSGVDRLSGLAVGDPVTVGYQLATPDGTKLQTALGGLVMIQNGQELGLNDDTSTLTARTAAGSNADGTQLYMVAVDASSSSVGATVKSMADIMIDLGATQNVINFDGGGSTTLVARKAGATTTSVRDVPTGGTQRLVANGLGVFPN